MNKTKTLTRILVVIMAMWGLSLLQPATSARKGVNKVVADDPCDCWGDEDLALENAENDNDDCQFNMDLQYEGCMNDAAFAASEAFWACADYYDWEEYYGNWCDQQAQAVYDERAGNCSDIYNSYLLPYCQDIYNQQVQQAQEGFVHCFCNCPFIDEGEKGGCW